MSWYDPKALHTTAYERYLLLQLINNKLKVLKRRCFGIYNLNHLFQRITLDLHGYRRFSPW